MTPISRSKPRRRARSSQVARGPREPGAAPADHCPPEAARGHCDRARPQTSHLLPGVAALLPLPRLLTARIFLKASPYENA